MFIHADTNWCSTFTSVIPLTIERATVELWVCNSRDVCGQSIWNKMQRGSFVHKHTQAYIFQKYECTKVDTCMTSYSARFILYKPLDLSQIRHFSEVHISVYPERLKVRASMNAKRPICPWMQAGSYIHECTMAKTSINAGGSHDPGFLCPWPRLRVRYVCQKLFSWPASTYRLESEEGLSVGRLSNRITLQVSKWVY